MAMNQGAPKTSNTPSRSRIGARPGCWSKYFWTRCGEMFCCGNRLPKMAATPSAATADRGQAEYGAERRPDPRRPPEPEHHPKRQRARQPAGDPVGPEPPLLVEEGGLEHPGKDQAHDDHHQPS